MQLQNIKQKYMGQIGLLTACKHKIETNRTIAENYKSILNKCL